MRKIFDILVGIVIFMTASAYVSGLTFGVIQGHAFRAGTAAVFLFSLFLKPLREIKNFWLNCIIALGFVATFTLPPEGITYCMDSLVNLFLGIILLYTIINYVEDKTIIIKAVCAVVILNMFMAIFQIMNIDPICLDDGGRPNHHIVGLFGFKYVFGGWMALAAPFLIFTKRWFLGIVALLLTIASMSWAAIGLCFASLLFGAWYLYRKFFIYIVALVISLALISYFTILREPTISAKNFKPKVETRIYLEGKVLPAMFAKPYFGNGLGSFKLIGPRIINHVSDKYGTMTDAWNDYIERGIECGLLMPTFMVIFFLVSLRRFLASKKTAFNIACFSALISVPFEIFLHDWFNHYSLVTFMIALFALFEITLKEEVNEDNICR